MGNESLIDNLEQLKQKNINEISTDQQTISSINDAIVQANLNLSSYDEQKIVCEGRISDCMTSNDLLDQTINILQE